MRAAPKTQGKEHETFLESPPFLLFFFFHIVSNIRRPGPRQCDPLPCSALPG